MPRCMFGHICKEHAHRVCDRIADYQDDCEYYKMFEAVRIEAFHEMATSHVTRADLEDIAKESP